MEKPKPPQAGQADGQADDRETMSRRTFIDKALWVGGVALVAAVSYPITRYLVPPEEAEADPAVVNVGNADDFAPNTGTIFKMGRKPGILIRTQEGEFRAFYATCTHLDCTVQYRDDMGLIWCACHNGRYDLNGINIAGPPPRPLTPLKVNVAEGSVFVSREEA